MSFNINFSLKPPRKTCEREALTMLMRYEAHSQMQEWGGGGRTGGPEPPHFFDRGQKKNEVVIKKNIKCCNGLALWALPWLRPLT